MHVCLNVGPSKVNQEEEEEVHGHWPDVNGWMDGSIDVVDTGGGCKEALLLFRAPRAKN